MFVFLKEKFFVESKMPVHITCNGCHFTISQFIFKKGFFLKFFEIRRFKVGIRSKIDRNIGKGCSLILSHQFSSNRERLAFLGFSSTNGPTKKNL